MGDWDWNRRAREAGDTLDDDSWYELSDDTKYWLKVIGGGITVTGLALAGSGYAGLKYAENFEFGDYIPGQAIDSDTYSELTEFTIENSDEVFEGMQYAQEITEALV